MNILKIFSGPILLIAKVFALLRLCSLVGGMIGAIGGCMFGLLMAEQGSPVLTPAELVQIALLLTALTGPFAILIVVVWLRRGSGSILPVLLNALLTCLAVVFITYMIVKFPPAFGLAGTFIGLMVGALLCWLCRRIGLTRTMEITHG